MTLLSPLAKTPLNDRTSGVLLHVSSLPSPYGIGTLGQAARDWIDFLVEAGQTVWQMLPLGVTGYGDSPYQSFSTRAGNPFFIDLDALIDAGWLDRSAVDAVPFGDDPSSVDYEAVWAGRRAVLRDAWFAFRRTASPEMRAAFRAFCVREAYWLEDDATFFALKRHFDDRPWWAWPEAYKRRHAVALRTFRERHAEAIAFQKFLQFIFFEQWADLRRHAHAAGIVLMGDVPIYVARDSVDVWRSPHLFQVDDDLNPTYVAGCPPDAFTEDGQLWGNPLYDWNVHAAEDYAWWIERMRFQLAMFDVVRIDHFRGFAGFWSVPAADDTARNGRWVDGPGRALFEAMHAALGPLSIIAEDLGFMTDDVHALRQSLGCMGMVVMQFAFDPETPSEYLPHNLTEPTVLYTGTHDNATMREWFDQVDPASVELARRYLGLSAEEGPVYGMLRGAATTVCRVMIYQMQDWLGLGGEARMNRPGNVGGYWRWRVVPGQLTEALARDMYELTAMSQRLSL